VTRPGAEPVILRFSRDRRGYEHFYLIQPSDRRGKSRGRILYWFRSPPNVKVGRDPFDPSIRRALEAKYPDVIFDWEKIKDTPIPRVEPEHWRERRDAARLLKGGRRDEPPEEAAVEPADAISNQTVEESQPAGGGPEASPESAPSPPASESAPRPRRRRRRRGRRAGHSGERPAAPGERLEGTEQQPSAPAREEGSTEKAGEDPDV
jgi:hypothetical protein